ncbi:hypothetical protein BCV70DRAFT_36008 [Testicularia cyperi]|uniref:Uncharacterized protein n=1 Tax=Testicularia cyperi TaxID=1882483 RepID=A0A317XKA8_9BASI|nr:hypothetical protein BCV70DRAFT_36008 [Testicularia cyperi]
MERGRGKVLQQRVRGAEVGRLAWTERSKRGSVGSALQWPVDRVDVLNLASAVEQPRSKFSGTLQWQKDIFLLHHAVDQTSRVLYSSSESFLPRQFRAASKRPAHVPSGIGKAEREDNVLTQLSGPSVAATDRYQVRGRYRRKALPDVEFSVLRSTV